MEFIAIVNTETGHSYMGPDTLANVTAEAREAIENDDKYIDTRTDKLVSMVSIYVLPYDVDEYPEGNADMAGEYFGWVRDIS